MESADYEKIRSRAYEIWEKEGRPSGRERQHWEQAQREVARDAAGEAGETAPGEVRAEEHRAKARSSRDAGALNSSGEQGKAPDSENQPETPSLGEPEKAAARAETKGKRWMKRSKRL